MAVLILWMRSATQFDGNAKEILVLKFGDLGICCVESLAHDFAPTGAQGVSVIR